MGAAEISCPQCGSPIELGDIREDRTAACGSCGSPVDLTDHLKVAKRQRVVVRHKTNNYGTAAVILWVVTLLWFGGAFFFSPVEVLREQNLVMLLAFVLYLTGGLVGLLLAIWATMKSGRKIL